MSSQCPSTEDLIAVLGELYGEQMQRLLRVSAFALGDEILDHDALLLPGTEVAVLPPVSGGTADA